MTTDLIKRLTEAGETVTDLAAFVQDRIDRAFYAAADVPTYRRIVTILKALEAKDD